MTLLYERLEELINEHSNLIHYILKRYYHKLPSCDNYEDLFQEGVLGLLYANSHYNPSLGFEFSTYASSCIRGHISRYFRDYEPKMHYSRSIKDKRYQVVKLLEDGMSMSQISSELKLSIEEINAITDLASMKSINDIAYDKSGNPVEFGGLIESDSKDLSAALDVVYIEGILGKVLHELYTKGKSKNCDLYKDVYEEYIYGSLYDSPPTQEQLAKKYSVSQTHISRILSHMNKRMRKFMEN